MVRPWIVCGISYSFGQKQNDLHGKLPTAPSEHPQAQALCGKLNQMVFIYVYINIYGYSPLFLFLMWDFLQHKSCQKTKKKKIINENSRASGRPGPEPEPDPAQERGKSTELSPLLRTNCCLPAKLKQFTLPDCPLLFTLQSLSLSAFFFLYLKYLSHSMQLAHKFCLV